MQINVKHALALYQKITLLGQKKGREFTLGELTAGADHDGYTVYITDNTVTLTIMFHNRYRLAYKKKHQLTQFLARMDATKKGYQSGRREQ